MPQPKQKPAPEPKPLGIFVIAEQFHWASVLAFRVPNDAAKGDEYLKRYAGGVPNMDSAVNACAAFALELYLKCLIRIGKKGIPSGRNGHNLVVLFNTIAKRHQLGIRRYFDNNSDRVRTYLKEAFAPHNRAIPEPLFDYVLANSKDAFVKMRYAYEGHPPDTGWLAHDIERGAREQILHMYPHWKNARQASFLNVIVPPTYQVQ
jgi:hypothetical protein